MFNWRKSKSTCYGSVLFRGSMPPRLEELAGLEAAGVRVTPLGKSPQAHWSATLRHELWGEGAITCLRDCPLPPRQLIQYDARLSDQERQQAALAGSTVTFELQAASDNLLRDRKNLLRFLGAIMGADESGLLAIDHVASRLWSREAVDDELAHDADLDIDGIYAVHVVADEAGAPAWLHTHGLAEIGFFDFDIMYPSPDVLGRGQDTLRAVAFAIVEGIAQRDTPRLPLLINPQGDVRMVDARQFNRSADEKFREARRMDDDSHERDRCVLCEPVGFFGRLLCTTRPFPSRLLSEPTDADMMVAFSSDASELMAERARKSYPLFRRLTQELAEFECTPIVKIGYKIDGGHSALDREHMWFEVHEATEREIDATLQSEPFGIASMKQGQRGKHPLELLSDWAILTPAGMVNPRDTTPARRIRANQDELREWISKARKEQSARKDA